MQLTTLKVHAAVAIAVATIVAVAVLYSFCSLATATRVGNMSFIKEYVFAVVATVATHHCMVALS